MSVGLLYGIITLAFVVTAGVFLGKSDKENEKKLKK